MASPLRIGLMGLGRAGRFHLQSLRLTDDAVLSCVFDIDRERCQQVAEKHACLAAEAPESLIGKDVDAVIVATPTDLHYELVQACLDAKKPVLSEKPLGSSLSQVDDCFHKSATNSTPLFVAFQRRFDPSFASLVQSVYSGEVGQLQFVRSVSRDNPVPSPDYIRISGGIFHDCMVHDLDMLVHIAREVPTHLSAFGSSFIPEIGELDDYDNVVASLAFESGVTASIDINRHSVFGYDQRIEAFGDGGMLTAENYHTTSVVHGSDAGFRRPAIDYSFPTRYRDAYLAELQCFVRCARGDQEVPISHDEVRTNYLLATGLEIAAKEQRVVRFEEIEPICAALS